ncbi:MAG: zinc ribbon domain-containing protein [Promethearchaeota archaeon]|nr:MAG: zinc ribbon domain-containing protein [Candidatus Lokiarchaeota archaeon]
MKFCEYCGHQNESDDSFCANCGKRMGQITHDEIQQPQKRKKSTIRDFFYLIYCIIILIIIGIVIAILYMIFGFWIELISIIVGIIILIGCISQIFTALIDWIRENRELKKKRKNRELQKAN